MVIVGFARICQVPKTRRPFPIITVTELPIIDVLQVDSGRRDGRIFPLASPEISVPGIYGRTPKDFADR